MVGMFGIQFGSSVQSEPSITLYLPEGTELKQTQIYTSYGDISLSSANLGDASIETASGNISLKDTTAKTLHLSKQKPFLFNQLISHWNTEIWNWMSTHWKL